MMLRDDVVPVGLDADSYQSAESTPEIQETFRCAPSHGLLLPCVNLHAPGAMKRPALRFRI